MKGYFDINKLQFRLNVLACLKKRKKIFKILN